MARYKNYNYDQMKMLPVSYEKQILPGSFEYSLSWLIDNELDLSAFDTYYRNDEGGRPAYDPRLLLKPVIERIRETFHASPDKGELEETKITADSGYHNREMLEYLEREGIDGYIADTGFRARDPRFRDHKAAPERNKRQEQNRFSQADFRIDADQGSCRCPAGYEMWLKAKVSGSDITCSCSFRVTKGIAMPVDYAVAVCGVICKPPHARLMCDWKPGNNTQPVRSSG